MTKKHTWWAPCVLVHKQFFEYRIYFEKNISYGASIRVTGRSNYIYMNFKKIGNNFLWDLYPRHGYLFDGVGYYLKN